MGKGQGPVVASRSRSRKRVARALTRLLRSAETNCGSVVCPSRPPGRHMGLLPTSSSFPDSFFGTRASVLVPSAYGITG